MTSSPKALAHQSSYHYDPLQRKCTIRGAREFPSEVFEIAEDIEILDASFGQLDSLPDNFGDLKNLRIAFFANNDFETIPKVVASCPNLEMVGFKSCKINRFDSSALPAGLRGLILTDNLLLELPASIGDLPKLQKLMLTGNRLTALPDTLLNCQNLELLRVSINQLSRSPDWLFQLPKLAWYSDSQNPFHQSDQKHMNETKDVAWSALEVQEIIGQSAKNVVYRANLAGRPVAVKLFGAGTTTDGAPFDDIQASLIAGDHPNVIGGIARVVAGPDQREGLLLPLVSKEYESLGLPPDFTTLTRDVFSETTVFTADYIARVASDVASALGHFSSHGVQHGDVYAHNILTNRNGESYIGDFGAASLYTAGTAAGRLREQLDVRGFGCLLDDLLTRADTHDTTNLRNLRDVCLDNDPASRPTFHAICTALKAAL